jgi:phosphopantetheine--protein transferase-like protein
LIGNDIVDLAEPGVAGKERDRRFMDRVFTPDERARILDATAPTIALWKAWSAKETAFKIASKVREGLVFHHQAFEVAELKAAWLDRARVRFDDLEIHVRWESARDYIHCIGHLVRTSGDEGLGEPTAEFPHDWQGILEYLRDRWRVRAGVAHNSQALAGSLTHAEQASAHGTPSERARLLARRLIERWDLQEAEIVRRWEAWRWSPPMVARHGERVAGFDVTLSHDGRFVAAAVAGPC